ncbi:hypothetical protein Tco_0152637 [Tanacetum coccineum]
MLFSESATTVDCCEFDQPPQYHIDPSPPQELDSESHFMCSHRDTNRILEELLRTLKPNSPVGEPEGSDDYTKVTYDKEQYLSDHYTAHVTTPAYTPSISFLATMEPLDTFLMGDEVISTIPKSENDEFIKSSVDDLVPIPRESEVTSDSDLKCDMPATTPLPTTDVREENLDINLPLGEHLDTLSTGDREIDFDPSRDIEELEHLLADDPVSVPRVIDEPLEKSSGSTTSHSDHSLPEYESFCFDVDHIEEKSSGSTTSYSDLYLLEYESFHFYLSIDPFPPANRSDSYHEEFADELAHISISYPNMNDKVFAPEILYYDEVFSEGGFPMILRPLQVSIFNHAVSSLFSMIIPGNPQS